MSVHVRRATSDDFGFILDAWRRSFEGSPAVRGAERDHYFRHMEQLVKRICSSAEVRIACDPEEHGNLVGFAAFTGTELHYIYVKKDFRGHGVARELLKGVAVDAYTFSPRPIEEPDPKSPGKTRMRTRVPVGWRFTPRFAW